MKTVVCLTHVNQIERKAPEPCGIPKERGTSNEKSCSGRDGGRKLTWQSKASTGNEETQQQSGTEHS